MTTPTVEFSTSTTTLVESEGTVISFNFNVTDGTLPEGGLPISLDVDGGNAGEDLWIVEFNNFSRGGFDEDTGLIETIFLLRNASGVEGNRSFGTTVITDTVTQPFDNIPLVLTDTTASFELTVFDDFYAEGDETISFSLSDGDGYTSADSTPIDVTILDDPNPTDVPVVSLSIDAPDPLIEDLPGQKAVTFNFTVDETLGPIPAEGLQVFVESDSFDILGDFVRDSIVSEGLSTEGRFGVVTPVELGRGFYVTILDTEASLTIDVANDNVDEGIQNIAFDLVDGETYDVSSSSVAINIQDPPTPTPIRGTNRDDVLVGGRRNNMIEGRAGDDRLLGRSENDTLIGGDGKDTLEGRAGLDSLEGGKGKDSLLGGAGNDFVAGGAGNDTIRGGENDSVIDGGAGNDLITAVGFTDGDLVSFSDETITGGEGNDTIFGKGDDDLLFGDAGKDRIFGGADEDSISGGAGNDVIFGGSEDDLLSGDAGNDRISGGDGDDLLMGVTGRDTLIGGAGSDTFVFGNGDGRDLVLDFDDGVDKIGLVEGELEFDDLKIKRLSNLDLRVKVTGTGETLAIIQDRSGVINLDATDFVSVADVSDFTEFL